MGPTDAKEGASVSDVLGIKPVGEAALVITKAAVDAAGAFLSKLCMPAAEEMGLLLRDEVARWRTARLVEVAQKAQARMCELGIDAEQVKVLPRLGITVIDQGSWTDDDALQDMWAGLLVSSATPDGRDESNLVFTDLLSRMTAGQARLISFACGNVEKKRTKSGLLLPTSTIYIPINGAMKVAQISDLQQLDRELDHLRALGLIIHGIVGSEVASAEAPPPVDLTPTALALQMYARCQGARDPLAFYGVKDAAPVDVRIVTGLGGPRMIVDESK